MSEICSEKDCRTVLEGERDGFGTSTGMPGEGREEEERDFFPPRSQNKGYYMSATGGDVTPSVRQMTKFRPCSSALTRTFERIQVHTRDLSLV